MCGIAGMLGTDCAFAEQAVRAINVFQAHRGPDDHGLVTLPCGPRSLVLGHRRLSILDLSQAGHQPMQLAATGDWIVFNGEIYNFRELRQQLGSGIPWRGESDTEVILQAFAKWGTDALRRLEGMFALALYDHRRQQLLLARDPLGIKPLYYSWTQQGLLFASEMRALQASGAASWEVEPRAVANYFAYGAVSVPLTMTSGVRLLEPGTWMSVDVQSGNELKTERYWQFPQVQDHPPTHDVAAEEFREHLQAAVKSHLISDVPVGVFLSSGLDSSALAALAVDARDGDLETFTIRLEGDPRDENPVAEQTARFLGTRHHATPISQREVLHFTQRWLDEMDQPTVDGLNTYLVSYATRQAGMKVALSGLGSDEILGGYRSFGRAAKLQKWLGVASWIPSAARGGLARLALHRQSRFQRDRAVDLARGARSAADVYCYMRRIHSNADLKQLGLCDQAGLNQHFLSPEALREDLFHDDPFATVSALETHHYMGSTLLRDSDVFAMRHGLEIRVPFLDRTVTDYVLALPGQVRAPRGSQPKSLLRKAMARRLPANLFQIKKRGFSLPQAGWMRGPLRAQFEHYISAAAKSGFLQPAAATQTWNDFLSGNNDAEWCRPWSLAVFGRWLERQQELKGEVQRSMTTELRRAS